MPSEMPLADELAGVFVRVSGLLLSAETVRTALKTITSLARETFPRTAGSGISLMDPDGERTTTAATDALVERADAVQYELGQGPCLAAWEERAVVRVDDVAQEKRWPDWVRAMTGVDVRSALSAPLVAGARALGALKVYAAHPNAYGEREEHLLTMFAAQAAILLNNLRTAEDAQRVSENLKHAMHGRDVITLGKGIIMARDGVDERTAFLLLADEAQLRGETLRGAAEHLVRSTAHRTR